MRRLGRRVVGLLGQADTPDFFSKGLRLRAVGSFKFDLFDRPANARVFGYPKGRKGPGAFPQARVLALGEAGTHATYRHPIKPGQRGEIGMTPTLLRHGGAGMLILWDRNLFSHKALKGVRGRNARLHRLMMTTPLREQGRPAEELIVLYHERWEGELTIDEVKTHRRGRAVLRSQTPEGVARERGGPVPGHYAVRAVTAEAAQQAGVGPRRVSFVGTLKAPRNRLPGVKPGKAKRQRWWQDLVAEVSEPVPPRRNRINPRVMRRPGGFWPRKPEHHRQDPQPTRPFRDSIRPC
jgi:hypothetical protein